MALAKEKVMKDVRLHFRPELLNRLDEIMVFSPLSLDQLRKIARMQVKDVAVRLAERGVALAVTDTALDLVLEEAYDPVYGARPLRRWLERKVVTQLSLMLISGEIDDNSTVFIDVKTGKLGKELSFHVEKNGGLINSETGMKSEILINVPEKVHDTKDVKRMRIQAIEDDDEDMEEY